MQGGDGIPWPWGHAGLLEKAAYCQHNAPAVIFNIYNLI
jgi:hypothetical protein